MKCRWKYCKHGGEVKKEEAIQHKKGQYYHKDCYEEFKQYKKIKDLYNKYYNKHENWVIIGKTLDSWIKKYGVEYILFCLCKAIRNNYYLRRFQSLYYILTDKKYIDEYKKLKGNENDKLKLYGKYVVLRESEYIKLEKEMGQKKLHYYIDKINKYIDMTGKVYEDYYKAILFWKEKDDEKAIPKPKLVIHDS